MLTPQVLRVRSAVKERDWVAVRGLFTDAGMDTRRGVDEALVTAEVRAWLPRTCMCVCLPVPKKPRWLPTPDMHVCLFASSKEATRWHVCLFACSKEATGRLHRVLYPHVPCRCLARPAVLLLLVWGLVCDLWCVHVLCVMCCVMRCV